MFLHLGHKEGSHSHCLGSHDWGLLSDVPGKTLTEKLTLGSNCLGCHTVLGIVDTAGFLWGLPLFPSSHPLFLPDAVLSGLLVLQGHQLPEEFTP